MSQKTHKIESTSINRKLLERLSELKQSSDSEIIKFPLVFMKLCRNFSITKEECWSILFSLRDSDIIEIVPYHGIKIKNRLSNGSIQTT